MYSKNIVPILFPTYNDHTFVFTLQYLITYYLCNYATTKIL